MHPADISIQDFSYELPDEKIALEPLAQRDASRLLVYKKGEITENHFANIADLLPGGSLLVFNKTKVINARIKFKKASGANIEIFCLEPEGKINEYSAVMSATHRVRWKCFVGGAAKWKNETLVKEFVIEEKYVRLMANKLEQQNDAYSIELSWEPAHLDFATVIAVAGDVPLPPYIKRVAAEADQSRYQTIFADKQGSVAAPTAGLHFTENIFSQLPARQIEKSFVTLHVGAGTFKPVKAQTMAGHDMHAEYIDVERQFIQDLSQNPGAVSAVGTTSLRTIESLYWLGVKAHLDPSVTALTISQWDVYEEPLSRMSVPVQTALRALLKWMDARGLQNLFTQTQLLIAPGYRFRVANILITNFHQPQSTLLLLVAAAIGHDWRRMYEYALHNQFRFLSYGDGNLIFIN